VSQTGSQDSRNHDFLLGLVVGSVVGTALALLFAPRLRAEVNARVTESATRFGHAASERFDQVSTRVGAAMEEVAKTAQTVRDQIGTVAARVPQDRPRGVNDSETTEIV
jgi:gas vesicle protein